MSNSDRGVELAAVEMPIGTERVLKDLAHERKRAVVVEGFGRGVDDAQPAGRLAMAAAAYLVNWNAFQEAMREFGADQVERAAEKLEELEPPDFWPLDPTWWKPFNDRRDLVRAGQFIIAEIERLDREEGRRNETPLAKTVRELEEQRDRGSES